MAIAARTNGGPLVGWPAYLIVLIVLGAALYSFAHRPLPPFPETRIRSDRLLVNGLAETPNGRRLVAAGELGHILYADNADGPWQEAKIDPARSSTFTRVRFLDDKVALAVGHDGWIVRSADGGQTWKEVAYDEQRPDPLLAIAGPFDGKLYALGAFGLFLSSGDMGQTWQSAPLTMAADDTKKKEEPKPAADPNADPFAAFSAKEPQPDRHLNAMIALADGSLLIVGERGLLLQSRDSGVTWKELPSIYAGSFFGALALPQDRVLVFGMRGNAFTSSDMGKTWQKSATPLNASLFGGTTLPNGDVILVGDNNAVLKSSDSGAHFTVLSQAEHHGLAASLAEVIALPDGTLLSAGDGGVTRVAAQAPAGGHS